MKRWDITVLVWFFLLLGAFFVRDQWFALNTTMRIVSIVAALLSSFLLLLNFHLKTAGKALFSNKPNSVELATSEQVMLTSILKENRTFRRTFFLLVILCVTYLLTFISSIPLMIKPMVFYSYLVGWAVLCLIVDFQIRVHLLCILVKRILSQSGEGRKPAATNVTEAA